MPPLIVGWMVDVVNGHTPSWIAGLAHGNLITAIWIVGISIFVIFGFESFFEWLFQRKFMIIAQNIQHDIRVFAYKKLQEKDITFFEHARTGNLMSMLTEDIGQLERFFSDVFNQLLQITILIIFSTIVFYKTSPQLCLLAMIAIPFIVLGSVWYERKVSEKYYDIRQTSGELNSRLENNIGGIQVIKSFATENYETARVIKASSSVKQAQIASIAYRASYNPLIRVFIAFAFAAVLVVPALWLVNGTGQHITLGQLALFGMLVQRLLWPLTDLGKVFDDTARAKAALTRIFSLIDEPVKIKNNPEGVIFNKVETSITFNEVVFQYNEEGNVILENLSFNIPANKITGIVGQTGAGKTSLTKLLLRFYDPISGDIAIDGKKLSEFNLESLRNNISLVSQDVYVFHGTIKENIAYALPTASDEEIIKAAKKAALHDFVTTLDDQYHSLIGERGIKLSGGQRQRLSIARALLKNAPIIILDEATSAVDTATEKVIRENLDVLIQNKTAIIIAHRLSTIKHADNIIVLEKGQVFEQGTHSELLKQQGIYAQLWQIQAED